MDTIMHTNSVDGTESQRDEGSRSHAFTSASSLGGVDYSQ
jgi:hypothetical protein